MSEEYVSSVPMTPTPQPPSPNLPAVPPAVTAAQAKLAGQLLISVDQVTIVKFEAVDWPDGCLGVMQKGMMCTDVVTPGYQVILAADKLNWEYHTDKTGNAVVLAKRSTS